MNKEREDKALPNYVSLAIRQELHDSALKEQGETIKEVQGLLLSLHKYHGNPENEKGWLEMIHDIEYCRKKNENKHRSTGFKLSITALGFGVVALMIDSINRGETSIFLTMFRWGKGLFGL